MANKRTTFNTCATKLEKWAVKYYMQKSNVPNFVDLSVIFCPWYNNIPKTTDIIENTDSW